MMVNVSNLWWPSGLMTTDTKWPVPRMKMTQPSQTGTKRRTLYQERGRKWEVFPLKTIAGGFQPRTPNLAITEDITVSSCIERLMIWNQWVVRTWRQTSTRVYRPRLNGDYKRMTPSMTSQVNCLPSTYYRAVRKIFYLSALNKHEFETYCVFDQAAAEASLLWDDAWISLDIEFVYLCLYVYLCIWSSCCWGITTLRWGLNQSYHWVCVFVFVCVFV